MNSNITGIILAGGKSSRMGRDKSLIKLGEKTLIEHIVKALMPKVKEIIIVTNEKEKYAFLEKVSFVTDIERNQGPLMGLISGISSIDTQWCFVTSCDMPLIDGGIIDFLWQHRYGYIITPSSKDGFEPMVSIYSKNILPYAFDFITENKKSVNGFIAYMSSLNLVKIVDKDLLESKFGNEVFFNINEENDYKKLLEVFNGR